MRLFGTLVGLALIWQAGIALAQTEIEMGVFKVDPTQPVEVVSDSLSVDQSNGTAAFSGNVVVAQGALRMTAQEINVQYVIENGESTDEIERLTATGGVVMISGDESVESEDAVYSLTEGQIVLSGGVILTQGPSAMSGGKLVINLETGSGVMSGRVRTVLKAGASN